MARYFKILGVVFAVFCKAAFYFNQDTSKLRLWSMGVWSTVLLSCCHPALLSFALCNTGGADNFAYTYIGINIIMILSTATWNHMLLPRAPWNVKAVTHFQTFFKLLVSTFAIPCDQYCFYQFVIANHYFRTRPTPYRRYHQGNRIPCVFIVAKVGSCLLMTWLRRMTRWRYLEW